jgi:acetyl-CoA acyltransferase
MDPTDLGAIVLNAAVQQAGVIPGVVDDVIWGCVTQVGDQGANLGRLTTLKAGFPTSIPAVTVNRMCGSSQQALHFAVQAVLSGDMDMVIAGGTEMMSHQPIGSDWPERWPDDFPFELVHQGISAELMARKWDLSRDELDDYAYESHVRALTAIDEGHFDEQIIPIMNEPGNLISTDEGVRRHPDRDAIRRLPPAFEQGGVVTAANSSQVSDGSAAVVIASPKIVGSYNILPRARVIQRLVTGSDPVLMLDGPIEATRSILKKAGITLPEIDIIEINEAFASVVLAWKQELDADMVKVNPNGGAIALGHPLGATGAILMTKLLHELERVQGRFGLQTMCIGHGMATATIIERI